MRTMVEHHNPIGKMDYLSIQHVERYRFAVSKLKPKMRVLDIASGCGYGSAILLTSGCEVVGAERDYKSIKAAQNLVSQKIFLQADAYDTPFYNGTFDAVVNFETIEHVRDGKRFLSEMHRVIKPGGIYIGSTPNIWFTIHPSYHLHEYKPEEFYTLAEQVFPQVERYCQYFKPSDWLMDRFKLYFQILVVPVLEKLGIKGALKRMLSINDEETNVSQIENNISIKQMMSSVFKLKSAVNYKVKPLFSNKWLRIMVVVAKKGCSTF